MIEGQEQPAPGVYPTCKDSPRKLSMHLHCTPSRVANASSDLSEPYFTTSPGPCTRLRGAQVYPQVPHPRPQMGWRTRSGQVIRLNSNLIPIFGFGWIMFNPSLSAGQAGPMPTLPGPCPPPRQIAYWPSRQLGVPANIAVSSAIDVIFSRPWPLLINPLREYCDASQS